MNGALIINAVPGILPPETLGRGTRSDHYSGGQPDNGRSRSSRRQPGQVKRRNPSRLLHGSPYGPAYHRPGKCRRVGRLPLGQALLPGQSPRNPAFR